MYENEFFSNCTQPNDGFGAIVGSTLQLSSPLSVLATDLNASNSAYRFGGHSSDSALSDRWLSNTAIELDTPQLLSEYASIEAVLPNSANLVPSGLGSFSWYDALTGQTQAWLSSQTATVNNFAGSTSGAIDVDSSSTLTRQYIAGSLNADVFTYNSANQRTIFSGNGNVDFGQGWRDVLNLSNTLSTSVSFNFATASSGGVQFNPGNGTRVFDAIDLNNGNQILFEGLDSIKFADGTLNLSVIPNDPEFSDQWNLHMMGVHNAWRFTTGSSSIMVGVQDTGLGVDYYGYWHPDLRPASTYIYTNNYQDEYFREVPGASYGPRDRSHGTGVQSIIAAASNNWDGMSGINWNSDVFAIDVLDGNAGDQSLTEATQNMIDFSTSRGQRLIINMSLSGGSIDPALEQLVATNQNNALFVIASGNGDMNTLSNPASLATKYNNVIAVGASWGNTDAYGYWTTPGTRISYPGWWGSNYGEGLTLMGPSEVMATSADITYYGVRFDYDIDFNGTSAATPNVAGVASLVWSANPSLTATQVQTILSETTYDLGGAGRDRVYGNGFVNADAAVRRAVAIAQGAA